MITGVTNLLTNVMSNLGGNGAALPAFDYHLILAEGQSNMSARNGPIDGVLDATDADILQPDTDAGGGVPTSLVTAADPLNHWDAGANTVGMGLTYAKLAKAEVQAINPNAKVVIIPLAKGSTGFSGSGGWKVGDAQFEEVEPRCRAVEDIITGLGKTFTYHSVISHQGEKDNGWSKAEYQSNKINLIARIRNILGDQTIPYIVGDLISTSTNGGARQFLADIENIVPYSGFAASTDLTDGGDGVHFDAASQRTFGQRYYDQYASGLSGNLGISVASDVTDLATTSADSAVILDWTAPSNGGSAIVTYQVEYKLTADSEWTEFIHTVSAGVSLSVTGLTNDEEYQFRIRAINAAGFGGYSNTATETPAALPTATDGNHVIDYSAQDPSSYTSGQTWTDLKGNNDAWLGDDGTTESTDPTFSGTAGDVDATFTMGGDYFTIKSTPALLANAHRSDGTPFTITTQAVINGTGNVAFMGCGASGSAAGIEFLLVFSGRQLRVSLLKASGVSDKTVTLSTAPIGVGAKIFSFGLDPATGDYIFKYQGGSVLTGNMGAATTTDATPNEFKIGANGAGTAGTNITSLDNWAVANKKLSEAEIDAVQSAFASRVT